MKKAPSPARAGVIPWGPWLRKGGAEVQTPSLFLTWDVCAPGSPAAGLCLECTPPAPGSQASGLDGPHRQPSWAPSSPQQWRDVTASGACEPGAVVSRLLPVLPPCRLLVPRPRRSRRAPQRAFSLCPEPASSVPSRGQSAKALLKELDHVIGQRHSDHATGSLKSIH